MLFGIVAFLALGISAILYRVYKSCKKKATFFKDLGVPGPTPHPIYGNLLEILEMPPQECLDLLDAVDALPTGLPRPLDLVLGEAQTVAVVVDGVPTLGLLQDILLPEDLLAQALREAGVPGSTTPSDPAGVPSLPAVPVTAPAPSPGAFPRPASPSTTASSASDLTTDSEVAADLPEDDSLADAGLRILQWLQRHQPHPPPDQDQQDNDDDSRRPAAFPLLPPYPPVRPTEPVPKVRLRPPGGDPARPHGKSAVEARGAVGRVLVSGHPPNPSRFIEHEYSCCQGFWRREGMSVSPREGLIDGPVVCHNSGSWWRQEESQQDGPEFPKVDGGRPGRYDGDVTLG
ncbi:hypothetical protein ISCGN_021577 [Ixodes scapularis]